MTGASTDGPARTEPAHDLIGPLHGGPPVIVLPGGPARDPVYLGDLGGLGRTRPLAVVHPRGVGRSPAPADPAAGSAWEQADDVEALRARLGLDRAVVLAHSAAARTAVAWACANPGRVAGVCLVTPALAFLVGAPTDTEPLIEARRGDPSFAAAVATLATDPPDDDDGYTAWQRAAAPAGYARWGDVEQEHARTGRWSRSAAATFLAPAPAGLIDRISAVTAPVLVIAGAQDVFTGTAGPSAVADLLPAGRAVVIDDCGHYPWVEQPEALRIVVEEFLTSIA